MLDRITRKLLLGVAFLPVAVACDGSGVTSAQVSTPEEFEAHLIEGGRLPSWHNSFDTPSNSRTARCFALGPQAR